MIKLIATDMDGTLLNRKGEITEENIEAIKFAQDNGVNLAIVTGRDYDSVKRILGNNEIECSYILMNGAEYRDTYGDVINRIVISKEKMKSIIDIFTRLNLSVEIVTNDGLYITNIDTYENTILERKKFICENILKEEIESNDKYFELNHNVKYIEDIDCFLNSNIEIYKVITFSNNINCIITAKDEAKKIEGLAVSSTFDNDIEITDSKAQKGLILTDVIENMGLLRDEVMVIGDSFNDYTMFEEFKNSFAMENAIPEIKEISRYITNNNDNSGVANAIYNMLESNFG